MVFGGEERQICTVNPKCRSALECFYQKVSVNLCFEERSDCQEYISGVCAVVYLLSKYLRNDGAAVVSTANNRVHFKALNSE